MLKDILSGDIEIVFCGTAKGKKSASLGYYYAGPGNKFYSILHAAGFTPFRLSPSECYTINQFGIGLTDLVHCEAGNDNQIKHESYEVEAFIKKMKDLDPPVIAFTSKKAASYAFGFLGITSLVQYGLQTKTIGESNVFVLPSTSGNARRYWDEIYWFQLNGFLKDKCSHH